MSPRPGPFSPTAFDADLATLHSCDREGRLKITQDGRIIGRSHQSELPAQLGSLLDWLLPPLSAGGAAQWSSKANLRLAAQEIEYGFAPWESRVGRVFVARQTNYELSDEVDQNGTMCRVEFRTADTPVPEFNDEAATEVEFGGSFRFDSEAGCLLELNIEKETGSDSEEPSSVKLKLERIDASAVAAHREELSPK